MPFPTSPSVGDMHTTPSGTVYERMSFGAWKDVTNAGSTVTPSTRSVDNEAGLAIQPTTANEYRVLGRDASFEWSPADLSAEVTADPDKTVYVPPSGGDGSGGAYVMKFTNRKVKSSDVGMVSSATVDQHGKMSKVIEYINGGDIDEFTFTPGVFQFSQTIPDVTVSDVAIRGSGRGSTLLRLDAGTGTHRGRLLNLDGSSSAIRRLTISDFSADCQSGADQIYQLLRIEGAAHCSVERIYIGAGAAGVAAVGLAGSPVSALLMSNITGSFLGGSVTPFDFGDAHACTLSNSYLFSSGSSTTSMLRVKPGDGMTADNIRFDNVQLGCTGGSTYGAFIDSTNGSVVNVWIENSSLEYASNSAILIRDAGSTTARNLRGVFINGNVLATLTAANGGAAIPTVVISQAGGATSRIEAIQLNNNVIAYDDASTAVRVNKPGAGSMSGFKASGNTFAQMAPSAAQAPSNSAMDLECENFIVSNNDMAPRYASSFLRTNYLVRTIGDVNGFKVFGNNTDGALLGTMSHFAYATPNKSRQVFSNSSPVGALATPNLTTVTHTPASATISGAGAVAATSSNIRLTSNTGSADDLTDLTGGEDGQRVLLSAVSGHTITVVHAVNKFRLAGGTNKVLTSVFDSLELEYRTTANAWVQVSYSDNS